MKDNRGFTLIEVLLSIIILGVIITSFFQFFVFSQKTTTNNQNKLVAINLAQTVLEQIKEDSHSQVNSQGSDYWEITHPGNTVDYSKPFVFKESAQGQQYDVEVVIGNKLANGLQMVTVSVQGNNDRTIGSVKGLVEL